MLLVHDFGSVYVFRIHGYDCLVESTMILENILDSAIWEAYSHCLCIGSCCSMFVCGDV